MVKLVKSSGQALVERIAEWLSGYMAFTEDGHALVLALWVIHTWVSERFDATPYLCVTAVTKQAGKTRLMKLLALLARQGRMFADMTPAAMFALIEESDCKLSIFYDEAEKLSSAAAGVMRSVMNTGYTQGQTVTRRRPGGVGTVDYRVFCPKAFALIGDVNDTLRDRSIVVTLQRGKPSRDLMMGEAKAEAAALVMAIRAAFANGLPSEVYREKLDGREREIWSAIFGCAEALGLDEATMGKLVAVCRDMIAAKTAPRRRFDTLADSEDDAIDVSYGEIALRDLASVLAAGEPAVWSSVAVERMKAIADGPWRTFKGDGLTEMKLSELVSRFNVTPKVVRMVKGKGAKLAPLKRGYAREAIEAAALALGGVQ